MLCPLWSERRMLLVTGDPEKKKDYQKEMMRVAIIENLKAWAFVIPILVVCLAILLIFTFPNLTKEIHEESGTVVSLAGFESKYGGAFYMIVELDSGGTVRVSTIPNVVLKKGKKVILTVYTTRFFGGQKYYFKEYAE
jgi:hypothetical protein